MGDAAAGSLLRFTLLHELGHVLGDGESPHLATAESALEEIAERTADELMKVTG